MICMFQWHCRTMCFLCLLFVFHHVLAYTDYPLIPSTTNFGGFPSHHRSGKTKVSTRYISHELVFPPLPSLLLTDEASTAQSPLPVLYTNDPAQVSRWLADNVPNHGGILGFDVEVSLEASVGWLIPAVVGCARKRKNADLKSSEEIIS
jgi:hypothetical protein